MTFPCTSFYVQDRFHHPPRLLWSLRRVPHPHLAGNRRSSYVAYSFRNRLYSEKFELINARLASSTSYAYSMEVRHSIFGVTHLTGAETTGTNDAYNYGQDENVYAPQPRVIIGVIQEQLIKAGLRMQCIKTLIQNNITYFNKAVKESTKWTRNLHYWFREESVAQDDIFKMQP